MRSLLLLFSSIAALAAEPMVLKLDVKEANEDLSKLVQEAFTKLLGTDKALAGEFGKFESTPAAEARGKYSGEPVVVPIVVSEEEHADFRESGGTREIKQTIALYYRFDEGVHRGSETRSGFFAMFSVAGTLSYIPSGNDDFKLAKSEVAATFKGFSRTLIAPQPGADERNEAATVPSVSGSGSKPEEVRKPQSSSEQRSR